jgi:hypothetical protein
MRRSILKQILDTWTVGLSIVVFFCLGGLLLAQNIPPSGLPSGLPDDLSDMSPFFPCLGNLAGAQPPRCSLYVIEEAIWLRRDRIDSLPLQTLGNPGDVVLSTDAIDAPFRPGARLTVGHSFRETCWQIDGTYYYLGNWDDSSAIRDTTPIPSSRTGQVGNMFSPFTNFGNPPVANFDFNDFVQIRELSQFQNGELNLRYTVPMPHECLTGKLILGVRYTSVNEQFDYHSVSSATASSVTLTTLTRNDLIGPQIGGEFYFYAYPTCWIDVGIKGALCNNRAVQHETGTISNGGINVDQDRTRDATAYVGRLGVELVWQLTPHIITRMGYQAIWVNNIALATRNFNPSADILLNNGPPQIDTIGRTVYHGPHIGLEFDW